MPNYEITEAERYRLYLKQCKIRYLLSLPELEVADIVTVEYVSDYSGYEDMYGFLDEVIAKGAYEAIDKCEKLGIEI